MKIAIIVLHFGDIEVTKTCIKSLFTKEKSKFDLIIVNNTDRKLVKSNFGAKKITVINNKKNLGFAGGVNVGIVYALRQKADYICLLNNDTTITEPFFKKISNIFIDPKIGICSPAIQFQKNKKILFDLGGNIDNLFGNTWHTEVESISNKNKLIVPYVSGCCMIIRKEVFKKIGLFDESFFLYYEDVDFCLRARRKGLEIAVDPSIIIKHQLSKSAGKLSKVAIENLTKSSLLFGRKYFSSGVKKYAHLLFVLYQGSVFTIKSRYGSIAWKTFFQNIY